MIFESILHFVNDSPILTALYFIFAKILGAVLLFPGAPLTLLAGATFGFMWGSIISIIGNTLGAFIAFMISRYLIRDYITKKLYPKYPVIEKYESRFFTNGLATVLLLRLIPLFPFNALNYLLGITKVNSKDYFIGTAIGMIPGTLAYVYFGNAIAMLSVFHIGFSLIAIIGLVYISNHYKNKLD